MANQHSQGDAFEQIQSSLYGVALTQEQLQDVYRAGTSDGIIIRENGNAEDLLDDSGNPINGSQALQD